MATHESSGTPTLTISEVGNFDVIKREGKSLTKNPLHVRVGGFDSKPTNSWLLKILQRKKENTF